MTWDEDRAATRCTRMWFRLGKALEKIALERAERGSVTGAMEAARRADVCFWQATGVEGSISMKDIVSEGGAGHE